MSLLDTLYDCECGWMSQGNGRTSWILPAGEMDEAAEAQFGLTAVGEERHVIIVRVNFGTHKYFLFLTSFL